MVAVRTNNTDKAPSWLTPQGLETLEKGYLQDGETPRDMYRRVSEAAAARLGRSHLAPKFFRIMWNGWLGLATPVAANMGTDRGLPISCYGGTVKDSISGIFESVSEVAFTNSRGGGIGLNLEHIRPSGKSIFSGGRSSGVVPWCKILDATTVGVHQAGVRRGALALYLPIEHPDFPKFLNMRRPMGDSNLQCLNVHHGAIISDAFMESLKAGDPDSRKLFGEILKTRHETGEPYLMFRDNANRQKGECYDRLGLDIRTSQLCNEIYLYSDFEHTFVCCLSSLNLTKWDEWCNTDTIQLAIWFLDGVVQEFLDRAKLVSGFDKAVRFARKSRALGLGVLGYHTALQQRGFAFKSYASRLFNKMVFKKVQEETIKATRSLAKEYGEPEWCRETGRRHTHLTAIAPTFSNSVICGGVSPGIEPLASNCFTKKSAKGSHSYENPVLIECLETYGKNTPGVKRSIKENLGSVLHLDFLPEKLKLIFLTAREIPQRELIHQAADRQKYLEQGQSLNIFTPADVDETYLARLHYEAWKRGLLGLYYHRSRNSYSKESISEPILQDYQQVHNGEPDSCLACDG